MIRSFSGDVDLAAIMKDPAMDFGEAQIAKLLEFRFGDGLVYLPRNHPKQLLLLAKQHGFVDPEGYLTRKGRALMARYCIT